MNNINKNTRKIAYLGLMLAVIVVLGVVEHSIPPLPFLPPNVKLGLSNVVTMYCLFFIGKKEAITLACLKSIFVFISRGAMASALSISGGLLSIFIIIVIKHFMKNDTSYIILSISGAVFHNIGQICAIMILLKSTAFFYYTPFLIIAGVLLGTVTGKLLEILLPALNKAILKNKY